MDEQQKGPKSIQSVHRALDILEFLVSSGNGQKLASITEHCHLNKTTAFHLIKTLEMRGYLEQSPDSMKYKTGGKIFEIALQAYQNINLNQICQPYLERVLQQFDETVGLYHYSKNNGTMQVICTSILESAQPVKVSGSLGQWMPLSCTAAGRMYLSCLQKRDLDEVLAQPPYRLQQEEIDQLSRQISEVCAQKFCIEREEHQNGVVNLAVPIYKYSGRVIASIGVSVPSQRADAARLKEIIKVLQPIARALSALPL